MRYIVALAIVAGIAAGFKNPVVNTDCPDPGILYYGGKWWMVNTGGNFAIRSSPDLVTWTYVGDVLNDNNRPKWAQYNFWAPELHVINGRVNVYFSAHSTSGQYAIGGGYAASPAGPYTTFENYLVTNQYGAIDASVMTDNSTGTKYLIWKVDGNAYGVQTPILAAKLTKDGSAITGTQTQILDKGLAWEEALVEGPWVVFHNNWYYMFYSGACYADNHYASGVARSRNILGPYEKSMAPILSQYADYTQTFTGPGHGSVVQIPETGAWYMVYHSWLRGQTNGGPGRVALVDRVYFDGDGWPVVGMCNTPCDVDQPSPISKEGANLNMDQRLFKNGKLFKLSPYQWSDHCMGIGSNNVATIDGNCDSDRMYARPGLVGGSSISIQHQNGMYLRHANGGVRWDSNDGSDLFKWDASWAVVAGTKDGANGAHVSFRPINYPFNFIRHYNGNLKLDEWDNSDTMAQDSTFRIHWL